MLFSLIHATKKRPAYYQRAKEQWFLRASGEHGIEYVTSIDEDDEAMKAHPFTARDKVIVSAPQGSASAYTLGAHASTGDVLIQVMDDCSPPENWDLLIAGHIGDVSKPAMLKVSDGTLINPQKPHLITVSIGTRAWYKSCGYMFYPRYRHLFADEDMSRKAMKENVIIEAPGLIFKHAWLGPSFDDVMRANYCSEQWKTGSELFKQREAEGFPSYPEMWPA